METAEVIKSRRSTRKYQARPVEREKLSCILDAGRYAPSGGNNQTTHFLVIQKKEVLEELALLVRQEFAQMEITPGMYKSMAHSIRASKEGNYVFHYNAPVLILTANQKDYGNQIADCACALENMMLMANELDLEENERVYGAVSVGYADTKDGNPIRMPLERTGNPVTWI